MSNHPATFSQPVTRTGPTAITVRLAHASVGRIPSLTGGNVSRRKNKRIEATEDLATSAVDRVAPLIHSAADQVGPLAQAAADKVAPLAQGVADRVAPIAQAAAEKVQPYAQSAADTVTPYAHQAAEIIEPYAHSAAEKVAPYAKGAREYGTNAAHEAADKLAPKIDEARERVSPALEHTRDRVQNDWLPKLADRLSEAAQGAATSATAIEAQKRSRAAAAALRGELILPEDGPAKKSRWVLKLGLITALGGLAFFLVKRFLGGKDSDWQTARPSPYTSTTITEPARSDQNGTTSSGSPTAPGAADSPTPAASVVASHDSVFEVAPDAADVSAKPAHAAEETTEHGDAAARESYGEHAFIGAEPPEGFAIKANERSKKFHLPESAGYGRTQTEVWFDTEEAAEAAGFTKAQH